MIFWILFAPLTPALVRIAEALSFEPGRRILDLLRALGFGLGFVAIHLLAVGSLRTLLETADSGPLSRNWFQSIRTAVERAWALDGIIYGTALVLLFARAKSRRLRERELEAANLRQKLTEARLTTLTTQLQPHFLFNTLHTIGVIAKRDPEEAGRMISLLGDLLRSTLENGESQRTTLRSELAFLEKFLQIERIRFRDRLQIEIDVPEEILDSPVPRLLLQPLVENSVRHGIEKKPGVGVIRIRGSLERDWLALTITDNGIGFSSGPLQERRGLGNTRQRLQLLYGPRHHLELGTTPNGEVEVSVKIPREDSR